jgi:hypothetical protein
LFSYWPDVLKPIENEKIIIIVGSNAEDKDNIYGYIDENGPYIALPGDKNIPIGEIDTSADIEAGTVIILAGTYYTQYS